MEFRFIRRPAGDLFSSRTQCLFTLNASSRRQQSSYRRSKQRLNIAPEPSFLLDKSSPKQDHIIFNPPSSAPSVLHTPLKFLPKEDKRRQLLATTAAKLQARQTTLPPPVHATQRVPHHHLSDKDIEEIHRLKKQEPDVWTNTKLARKFNCSSMFISICFSQSGIDDTKRKAQVKADADAIAARWGPKRTKARADRAKRFELALRGE